MRTGSRFGNYHSRGRSTINLLLFLLASAVWLEPGSCVSPPHQSYESHRGSRETDADPAPAHSLQFVLLTNTTAECVGRLGSNVSVELSYRTRSGGEWQTLCLLTRGPGTLMGNLRECVRSGSMLSK